MSDMEADFCFLFFAASRMIMTSKRDLHADTVSLGWVRPPAMVHRKNLQYSERALLKIPAHTAKTWV